MPNNDKQLKSSSFIPAELDTEFILGDSMRGVRLHMEFAKVEERLQNWGISTTVVVFGSARVAAANALIQSPVPANDLPARDEQFGRWYREARQLAKIVSERGGALVPADGVRHNVIATGGGPGLMEAANRGAFEAGAPSIGFNIQLPHAQEPNSYTTPDLTFQFRSFAIRKVHLAMRAAALIVFPGGFGTFDELFEILTLVQTQKMPAIPVVCFDSTFWKRAIDFDFLVSEKMIELPDLEAIQFADDAEQAWRCLTECGLKTTR
jgi:uncharacterized protein (TIGR00730 family)